MAGDTPGFMKSIPDTEEGKAAVEVLGDTPATETPAAPTTPAAPATETPAAPATPAQPATPATPATPAQPGTETKPPEEPVYSATDILAKKPEERTDAEKGELQKHPEVLTPEQKKQLSDEETAAKVVVTPATPATPASTTATQKVTETLQPKDNPQQQERAKFMETVETLKKIPLINPSIPNPDNYYNEDKSFNIAGYMRDFTKGLSIEIQKAMLGGPLAATMFGMLHDAMREEDSTRAVEVQKQQEAQGILERLNKHAPVLQKDEKLQTRFEDAIYGEKRRRVATAKAAGKEADPMKYEDYEKLLDDLIGGQPAVATPPADPTITPPGGPMMGGGPAAPVTELDQDIAGMQAVKNKQLF